MARRPSKAKAEKQKVSTLLTALEFVSNAQKNIGAPSQTHCIIRDGWCVASDNVLTMGYPVVDELSACPQTTRLIAVLRRCADSFTITQLDADRIAVKSGSLRVVVPCIEPGAISVVWGDPAVAPLPGFFLDACRAISHLAADGGAAVHLASLLGTGQTLSATNGRVVMEYWHGADLPPYWVLPKPSVTALLRITKNPIGFGFSGGSATFWFDDGSWLKTQLFENRWPVTESLFKKIELPTEIPAGLFEAIDILAEFAEPGERVNFNEDKIKLQGTEKAEAEHEVKGLRGGVAFSVKDLQAISKVAKTLDYKDMEKAAMFTGERLRGAIALAYRDDDIPF